MKNPWPIVLLICMIPVATVAQDDTSETPIPLRIEIDVRQGQDEHVTHTLHVMANRDRPTELRQGQEFAVPGTAPDTDYQYRNVGTNIKCRATSHGDKFLVWFVLEQSSRAETSGTPPSFHTFNIMNELLLADGESVELVAASNEMWRVEFSLNVVDD